MTQTTQPQPNDTAADALWIVQRVSEYSARGYGYHRNAVTLGVATTEDAAADMRADALAYIRREPGSSDMVAVTQISAAEYFGDR